MLRKQRIQMDFNGAICLHLQSRDKFPALKELVSRVSVFDSIKDKEAFLNAVFLRESERTTGFGRGVAVAHGKIASVKQVLLALGISKEGISYHALDGKPVHLLFLVATPLKKEAAYLKILASLMKILRNAELRQQITDAESEREVELILNRLFNGQAKRH